MLGKLLKKKLGIDQEFQQNQLVADKKDPQFLDQQGLLNYADQNPMDAQKCDEQTLDYTQNHQIIKNEVQQNIVERYNHEKNKIFFIIFTVKKIQKILKKNYYP